jgi:hypothetical protein
LALAVPTGYGLQAYLGKMLWSLSLLEEEVKQALNLPLSLAVTLYMYISVI